MNKVILMGRLTRDPEVRWTQGPDPVAVGRYTLAVDRRFQRDAGQSADFISCVCFGKVAEFAYKYLHQGTKVVLSGRIQTGSYTNREGRKIYTTDVIAEEVEFAESKAASHENGAGSPPGESHEAAPEGHGAPGSDGFMEVPDDGELPFN